MSLGIMAALFGVVGYGIANTAMKYIANRYDNNFIGLVRQYISIVFFAFLFVLIITQVQGTPFFPLMSGLSRVILAGVGIFGFIGIALLFESFDHLSAGVALTIANTAVFFMFFANILIFAGSESLPWTQMLLGLIFFVIVAQFILTTDEDHHFKLNIKALLPVGTALCWATFFVANTWFIKTGVMTPVQTVLMTEGAVFVVALLWYVVKFRDQLSHFIDSFSTSHIVPLILIGLGNVGGGFLFYYGYVENPANIINFIRLFAIIMTAILSWFFLGDRLNQRQIALMSLAFVVLMAFVFAESLL